MEDTAIYVWNAAVSSKGLAPVFFASSVCSNSSSPMLTCDQQSTLQQCACCPSEKSSDLLHDGLDLPAEVVLYTYACEG